ncbi:MAG: energy transducer TonB [Bacteroidales bacterium]
MITNSCTSARASGVILSWPVIIALMIFLSGNMFSIRSQAQENQAGQYNQLETQAGTPVMTPPRRHNPPQDKQVKDDDKAYQKPEKQPEYPGGTENLFRFLTRSIKYPRKAVMMKLEGKVLVSLTIKADGSVAEVETMRGIGGGCDEEAVRVVRLMPKWRPGENQGKPVDVSMILPVKFAFDTVSIKK